MDFKGVLMDVFGRGVGVSPVNPFCVERGCMTDSNLGGNI